MGRKTEHIEVPFELKGLDEDTGIFEGYASVFGNVDLGNDVVEPGAFKRTLDHTKGAIPILWFHDPTQPVGIGIDAKEDAHGLFVKGQLDLNTQRGREMLSGLKMGYIQSMSIGYKAIGKAVKDGVRHLTEVALPEYSLLTKGFAMNPEAAVVSVKAVADFGATIAAMEAEESLHRRRWRAEDALRKVRRAIEDDDTMDDAAKVAAFTDAMAQYSEAIISWFTDKLAADAAAAAAGAAEDSDEYMSNAEELLAKLYADVLSSAEMDGGHTTDNAEAPDEVPDVKALLDGARSDAACIDAWLSTL